MAEQEKPPSEQPPPPPSYTQPQPQTPPRAFDPSRMIGIIKRKALIKDLAASYHEECLAYCQELLELQKKWNEPYIELKPQEDTRKEATRPPKRPKKLR